MSNIEFLKDILKKNYLAILGIIFGIASIIGSACYVYFNKVECPPCEIVEFEETKIETAQPVETLKVDVKGAVKNPGVYELVKGTTVDNAIKTAGGITTKGTTTNINLARKLVDEMVVYVFTKEELTKEESSNEIVCEIPKCECESIVLNEPSQNTNNNTQNTTTSKNKISINTASQELLSTLEGIGEAKAKAIVSYREENGRFEKIEDIMNVAGIKETIFEKIKDQITI